VAGKVAGSLLGDENSAPAENMPEERQRRFWVSFFLKVMREKLIFYRVQ